MAIDLERMLNIRDDLAMGTVKLVDVKYLLDEVGRLHSWAGLMELLDEHWPEDIFPVGPATGEGRDPGPRIVSLIRWVDRLRTARDVDRLGYAVVGVTVDGHPFEVLPDIHADRKVAEAYAKDATEPDGARYGVVELLKVEET